jgi:DNA-binding NtrC family response regulator
MAPSKGRVLVVDDEPAMVELLCDALPPLGYEVVGRTSGDEALAALAADAFDVVLTDLTMRRMGGIELCRRVVDERPDVPVIVLTAFGSLESAVEAIRAGAYDFLQKPLQIEALGLSLDRALRHRALHNEVRRLRLAVEQARGFGDVVGESAAMQKVYDLLERVSDSDASVLLTGESGTGKEVVARALHRAGRRRGGPFVAINCAAMPEALLESELFGHAKGAFTDARGARKGLFVEASGGTLFLDEIGDMPLGLQPKLLRALQDRRVRPVGANAEVPFDARVVSATNRDLEAAVEAHAFREDLYYRLNVIHVPLPPLRARGGDLLLLAQKFLEAFGSRAGKAVVGLSLAAAEKLIAYGWPGNVRELQNVIERGVALARYDHLSVDDLPERVVNYRPQAPPPAPGDPSELLSMEEVERRHIARVLAAFGGNKTLAARTLGYDRTTLYRKLERYGLLDPAPAKPPR